MRKGLMLLMGITTAFTSLGADPALTLQGSGTAADPWIIASKDNLVELANACSNAATGANAGHFDGKYFKQTADIDMSGVTGFYGIGSAPITVGSGTAYYFGGNYDGGNYRIKNLNVDAIVYKADGTVESTGANKTRQYSGLFGAVKNGSVKNVIIDKSCTFLFYANGGAIVGRVDATATGGVTISNCINEADIKAYNNNIGGIVGYANRTATQPAVVVENCVNKGNILSQGQYIGGVVGNVTLSNVMNCANIGNVEGYLFDNKTALSPINQKYYGGVVGNMSGAAISNVINTGTVRNTSDYIGGICGFVRVNGTSGEVSNAVNIGSVMTGSTALKGVVFGQNGYGASLTYPITSFSNVYYDAQLSAAMGNAVGNGGSTGISGLETSAMTNGTALAGLNDLWTFTNGKYPMLKIVGDDADAARCAYFTMQAGKNTADFVGEATLSTALNGMAFSLAQGGTFKIAGGKLTVELSTFVTSDTVIARYQQFTRKIPVTYLPSKPFEGEGTAANPYLISKKGDLMNLAYFVNEQEHYKGKYFKQTADIDMENDVNFGGIGIRSGITSISPDKALWFFSGTYDGGGFSIKRLNIDKVTCDASGKAMATSSGGYSMVGLFCMLDTTAVIKNVNLDETCVIKGGERVGSIAGYMEPGAKVDNCSFAGKLYAYRGEAGGIVGEAQSPKDGTYPSVISNCVFTGEVHTNYQYSGGIVAYNLARVENCVSAGLVKGHIFNSSTTSEFNTNNSGGIAGYHCGQIVNCASYGMVQTYNNVGGIAGMINTYNKGGLIENCFSSALVTPVAGQEAASGSILGNITATANPEYCVTKAIYSDGQLATLKPYKNDKWAGMHTLDTDSLTTGLAIDSLAAGFVFEKGFYPMPKALAGNENVKKAASIFFTLEAPQTLKTISSPGIINNVYNLAAKLAIGNVFKIDGLRIVPGFSEEIVTDTLTLSVGNLSKVYPISKTVSFLKGEGTADNPWLIETVQDMNKIATNSTINIEAYKDKYFSLANDIDYKGAAVRPIGHVTPFQAYFRGNNHVVKNFKNSIPEGETQSYQGLFGRIGESGVVENIAFENDSIEGNGYVGLLAGYNGGKVINVTTDAKCFVKGVFSESKDALNGYYIGGINGYSARTSSYFNCVNRGNVTGVTNVGGIAGWSQGMAYNDKTTASITNCKNYGEITSTVELATPAKTAGAGGIAGYWSGDLKNCDNYGKVTSENGCYVGGLAGRLCGEATVDSCFNYGAIFTGQLGAGGLIGNNVAASDRGASQIINCGNFAEVNGGSYVGGITGNATTQYNYINTFNKGKVNASVTRAGGIIGGAKGLVKQTMSIENCWNSADVTSGHVAAGIIGYADENGIYSVSKCMNVGNVTENKNDSSYKAAAGIANGAISINNCNNFGNVVGTNFIGGILGLTVTSNDVNAIKVSNCYNLGEVSPLGTASRIGNIAGTLGVNVENCYTSNELKKYNCDNSNAVNFVAPFALTTAALGDQFVYNTYCFPIVKGMENVDAAKAYCAYFKATEIGGNGTYYDKISLSKLEGVVWTANSFLKIEGDTATPTGVGKAELTATCGDFSKTYSLNVDPVSVEGIEIDDAASYQYYTLDGCRLETPREGVNILEITTMSGKKIVKKVIVK